MAALDEGQVRELYERYAPLVFRRALTLVQREQDAWDVVQDVFSRLHETRAAFRQQASPLTYMYRMTVNASFDLLRRRKHLEPDGEASRDERSQSATTEVRDFLVKLSARLSERSLQVAALHYL